MWYWWMLSKQNSKSSCSDRKKCTRFPRTWPITNMTIQISSVLAPLCKIKIQLAAIRPDSQVPSVGLCYTGCMPYQRNVVYIGNGVKHNRDICNICSESDTTPTYMRQRGSTYRFPPSCRTTTALPHTQLGTILVWLPPYDFSDWLQQAQTNPRMFLF